MEAAAESHNTVLPEPARNPRRAGRNKTRDTPELNMPKEQTGTTTRRVKIIKRSGNVRSVFAISDLCFDI